MIEEDESQSDRSTSCMLWRFIVVSLLLGALTTIAIAWNSAIWEPVPAEQVRYWENGERDDSLIRTVFQEHVGFASIRRMSSPDPNGDWFYAQRPIQWWSELERQPVQPNELIVEDARGWPAFALRSVWHMHTDAPGAYWSKDRFIKLTRRSGVYLKPRLDSFMSFSVFNGARGLPTGVIWSGVVVNVIFWGLVWGLILDAVAGARYWRHARRRARNRCVYCRYDLSGLKHEQCPECGGKQEHLPFAIYQQMRAFKSLIFILLFIAIAIPSAMLIRTNSRPWSLAEAITINDTSAVEGALARGADPLSQMGGPQGFAHIQYAAQFSNAEIMDLLMRDRAVNVNGYSPPLLTLACMQDNGALIRMLLDRGADPNAIFRRRTVFAQALFDGVSFETIQLLLSAGANPDPPDTLSPLACSPKTDPEVMRVPLTSGRGREILRGHEKETTYPGTDYRQAS